MDRSKAGKLGAEKSSIFYEGKRKEKINEYLINPKKCKGCGKDISYEKRKNVFCGSSCSVSFNNKGLNRWSKKIKKCKNCNNEISIRTVFCNSECHKKYIYDLYWKKINDGSINDANRPTVKKYLILERGNQCEICNLEKWTGKDIPLVLDHIDGNSDNNFLLNLRLICNNCDALLPTYKGRNKGNGRKNRI